MCSQLASTTDRQLLYLCSSESINCRPASRSLLMFLLSVLSRTKRSEPSCFVGVFTREVYTQESALFDWIFWRSTIMQQQSSAYFLNFITSCVQLEPRSDCANCQATLRLSNRRSCCGVRGSELEIKVPRVIGIELL